MKIRRFLGVVPKAVQIWSLVIGGCAVLIAVGMGFHEAHPGTALRTMSIYASAGLLSGVVAAAWLLCLGFVFADARRRAMRPFLWVLVAALFPHLLGFLLYFVMRQPIASSCSHCGRTIPLNQRFCSWCGSPQPVSGSSNVPSGPQSSGLDSMTTS
jgi:zinc-ribbon domain/Phospholipase_D-nuclease N-terminal